MEEGLVQISSLERRHPPVLACFPVEEEVCGKDSSADDPPSVEELGSHVACNWADDLRGLHVGTVEGIARFGQS